MQGELQFRQIGMKRKQLLLGLTLLGVGVLASSPLFKKRIESNIRDRVEKKLAESPNEIYIDVRVADVDHLDVTLGGTVPTQAARKQVKPYIQNGVPGVGRVRGDVEVRQVDLSKPLITKGEGQTDGSKSSLSAESPEHPLPAIPSEVPNTDFRVEDVPPTDSLDASPLEESLALPSDVASDDIASQPSLAENPAVDTDSIVQERAGAMHLSGDASAWHLSGIVSDRATVAAIQDALRAVFPDAVMRNEIVVDEHVRRTRVESQLQPLTEALREADARDILIAEADGEIVVRANFSDAIALNAFGELAAKLLGQNINLKLSAPADEEADVNAGKPNVPADVEPIPSVETSPPAKGDSDRNAPQPSDRRNSSTQASAEPTIESSPAIDAEFQPTTQAETPSQRGNTPLQVPSSSQDRILAIGRLLGDDLLAVGDEKHLHQFNPKSGAAACLHCRTSTCTPVLSLASSPPAAPWSGVSLAGGCGASATNGLVSCKPICGRCNKISSKPKCNSNKTRTCNSTSGNEKPSSPLAKCRVHQR